MSEFVPVALRDFVQQRAGHRCEYCLIHEVDGAFSHAEGCVPASGRPIEI